MVERFTPVNSSLRPDALRYEVTIEDTNVFTRPWKMNMVLYRQLEDNAQLMEYKCVELVEETFLGHLRKKQLVKHWEGDTIVIDVEQRALDLEISEQTMQQRLAAWTCPPPRYTSGVFAKYVKLVSSASQGAVTG